MTDAREKHDQFLLGAIADGIWQGHRRKVNHYRHDWAPLVIDAMEAARFRIIGKDELDSVEKALEQALDLLNSSLREMAPISAENHRRRVVEFIANARTIGRKA